MNTAESVSARLQGVVSRGIRAAAMEDGRLIFTLTDGSGMDLGCIGVSSIVQSVAGEGSDAANVLTISYADGSTADFTVRNGGKGDKGETGATGPQGPMPVLQALTNEEIESAIANFI